MLAKTPDHDDEICLLQLFLQHNADYYYLNLPVYSHLLSVYFNNCIARSDWIGVCLYLFDFVPKYLFIFFCVHIGGIARLAFLLLLWIFLYFFLSSLVSSRQINDFVVTCIWRITNKSEPDEEIDGMRFQHITNYWNHI